MKHKLNKITIVLYVLAVLFALFAVFALFSSFSYIGEMVSTGYITVSDSILDIFGYIFQNAGAPIFYAVGLFVFGYVINILKPGEIITEQVKTEAEAEVAEESVEEIVETEDETEAEDETAEKVEE